MRKPLLPGRRGTVLLLPSSLLLLLALAGCGGSGSSPDRPAGGPPAEKDAVKYTIGISQCTLDEPWRAQISADIQAAAEKHPELKVVFKNAADDSLKQRADVDEFIAAGVSLIVISPKEAQPLTEPVGKAIDAGIPVVVLDRAIIGSKYTCFIGADNKKIGKAAGAWLARKLGGKGKIVELKGLMTSTAAQERHEAFRAAIMNPGFRVIFEADTEWKPARAREEMESALGRFSEIDAVFAHNDSLAYAAYQAAKAAGREKGTVFVGIDALPQEGVAYVAQGILDASFEYPTGGAETIETALRILRGEKVPKTIELHSRIFTKENVGQGGAPL